MPLFYLFSAIFLRLFSYNSKNLSTYSLEELSQTPVSLSLISCLSRFISSTGSAFSRFIRAISDKADDSAEMDYPTFECAAAKHCARLVKALVTRV